MLLETLNIPRRFNGPPQSANGGWAAGLLAGQLLRRPVAGGVTLAPSQSPQGEGAPPSHVAHAGIAVSLRAPPPLDTDMQVLGRDDGSVTLHHGDQLLAQASFDGFELEMPALPSMNLALSAGRTGFERAQMRASWPYAQCFGCGVARDDGLCITPGPAPALSDAGMVAAVWTPSAWLAQGAGSVGIEAVWAALDCPAGIAWSYQLPEGAPMVTARMALSIDTLPQAGSPYLVLGWSIGREGRKLHAGTALVDAQGKVLARSRQLWLVPREV